MNMRENPSLLTRLDRAILAVSPGWALRRADARARVAAWGGRVTGPRRGNWVHDDWRPSAVSPDAAVNPDLGDIHAQVADLVYQSPIARSAIHVLGTHVVGPGLEMRPAIDREALGLSDLEADAAEAGIKREWRLFANSQDASIGRDQTFAEIQRGMYLGWRQQGDSLALLTRHSGRPPSIRPYSMAIQAIGAERCSNPEHQPDGDTDAGGTMSAGVERDAGGAVIAYHFSDRHPGDLSSGAQTWTAVRAFGASTGRRNVLHLRRGDMVGQTRGISDFAAVVEPLKQLENYTTAEVAAAVKASYYAIFVESPETSRFPGPDDSRAESEKTGPDQLQAGIFDLRPGEKITSPVPGRPNEGFGPFLEAMLRQVSAAIRIPYSILALRFNDSFSAAQAEIQLHWIFVEDDRASLVRQFCTPSYEAWFDQAVGLGRVTAPGYFKDPAIRQAWLGARWTGRPRPVIRDDMATTAALNRIGGGLSSRSEEVMALSGRDSDAVHAELARESAMRNAAGLSDGAATVRGDDGASPSDT